MGVASLVLGIIAFAAPIIPIPISSTAGFICAVLAIIFGAISKKKGDKRGKAGLILGILSLLWGIILFVVCSVVGVAAAGALAGMY